MTQKKNNRKTGKTVQVHINIGITFHHNKIHLFLSDHISCCNVTTIHKQKSQFLCTMSGEALICERCKYELNKVKKHAENNYIFRSHSCCNVTTIHKQKSQF